MARRPTSPTRLPLRWALIILAGAGAGGLVGAAGGPAAGLTITVLVIGLLHTILD